MEERHVTVDGVTYELEPPFMVLATQNPLENEGTYPLPEAQLDRFLVKVRISYPSEQEEQDMLQAVTRNRVGDGLDVAGVATLVRPDTVVALQQLAARIRVDDSVANYAVRLVRATRDWSGIAIGAGPRGSIALVRLARAMALLAGRDYATPDDIKQAALPVLRHRIAISPESELDGLNADQLLSALVQQIAAPRA
jgi:MoxR-like ATPase